MTRRPRPTVCFTPPTVTRISDIKKRPPTKEKVTVSEDKSADILTGLEKVIAECKNAAAGNRMLRSERHLGMAEAYKSMAKFLEGTVGQLRAAIATKDARIAELEQQKDGAYGERNACVAALARMAIMLGWRAGIGQHDAADTAWDPEWRTVIYIDLPTGQVSWHIHDRERSAFEGLPEYSTPWDGHSTPEKYRRLAEFKP